MSGPRHPFEELLAQLTGAMKIAHLFGTQADADATGAPRIVWIPSTGAGLGVGPMPYQLPGQESPWRQVARFDVAIYGGSPIEVYQRHSELVGWIDLLVGPRNGCPPSDDGDPHRPGYALGDSKVEPRGGDDAARGWGTIVLVTLYTPIVRRFLPAGTVTSTTVGVAVTALDGSAPEAAV
jgi:hypothetical protein